ncbi:MAG: CRISPR system precrRNA processing endoribonuclease RAMP protein Cas6 [Anaerolineales bacterium]|nr:CRISPR system precrRNA processing endoribonuclease RAMP protein Cas6 [Anaerolineales bacterium]
MPLSAIISLKAHSDGRLDQFTGRGVHGFWFSRWREVDPALGDQLHKESQEAPFTLSPLMGLPGKRSVTIAGGQSAWLRVTCLTDALVAAFIEKWLKDLENGSQVEIPQARQEGEIVIPGVRWQVTGHALESGAHPFAAQVPYEELSRRCLMNSNPPRQWSVEFLTPTTFHGKTSHLPFPLPESLVGSWLRRWQAFAPLALPEEELAQWARSNLAVSAYRLHTLPVREGERLRVGCVGTLTLRALDMPPYLRAAIDLLANYALFCGSGSHTAQGMGQTRLAAPASNSANAAKSIGCVSFQ